jgi:hypothetical protein
MQLLQWPNDPKLILEAALEKLGFGSEGPASALHHLIEERVVESWFEDL